MVRAVIFDWYGTLAHWEHGAISNYGTVLESHGYVADPELIERYHSRWDGVDHHEHSVDRATYAAWSRERLGSLTEECGVEVGAREAVIDALMANDFSEPMVTYPEVLAVLGEIRSAGLPIAICSNWGWDLDSFLEATGVAPLVDVPVTSARAGFRKPHRSIYEATLRALDMPPEEVLFVGDSWVPDVLGPIGMGMTSVHVRRDERALAPALVAGSRRVSSLDEILVSGPLAAS